MPKEAGIGYGRFTPQKLESLKKIAAMHINVTYAVMKKIKRPAIYRYVDLTAGQGKTPDGKLPGAAVVFIGELETISQQQGGSYSAKFVEANQQHLETLRGTLSEEGTGKHWRTQAWEFHPGRYEDVYQSVLPGTHPDHYGLVFVDHSGDAPDLDALGKICRLRPKMEILLYLSSTCIKRGAASTGITLAEIINKIGKEHWFIRDLSPSDDLGWTFLMGTNAPTFKEYKGAGFRPWDAGQGARTFEKANYTKEKRVENNQMRLFDD